MFLSTIPKCRCYAPGGPQALSGPFDQAVLEMGNNLLVYTSEPRQRETEIFGQPRVRLMRVNLRGARRFYRQDCARHGERPRGVPLHRHRAQLVALSRRTLHADEIHVWEFTLEPIAFVLAPGERLRLEIASSAFPLYDRNPSTDVPPQLADHWNWARSTQQILHTASIPPLSIFPSKESRDGERKANSRP